MHLTMKSRLLLVALVLQTSVSFGQLSVYLCSETNEIGWSAGLENPPRDNNAYQHCKERGGKFPVLLFTHNGPGHFAIVAAQNDQGKRVYGVGAGFGSDESALREARSQAMFRGGQEKTFYTLSSGSRLAPKSNNTTSSAQPAPKPDWNEWRNTACANLQYRNKTLEGYDWNFQVHMYFQVKSNFKVPVSFVFGLYDKNGKMHFGDVHTLRPGEQQEFVHKMSGRIIESIRITEVKNAQTGRNLSCDDDGTKNSGESERDLMQEINGYAVQIPDDNPTKKHFLQRIEYARKDTKITEDGYFNVLKEARDGLKRLHESISKTQTWQDNANAQSARIIEEQKQKAEEQRLAEEQRKNEEQARKMATEKAAFDEKMQKGNAAMNSRNYPAAISYYQAAQNSTTDANDRARAINSYNAALEAKKSADREVRVEQANIRDKDENIAYGTMATAAAGAMVFLKDGYSGKGFAGKFSLGLGYEHSPILSNGSGEFAAAKSWIEERNLLTFHTGFTLGVLNNKPVSIYLKPEMNLGMSALVPGVSGGYFSYGGAAVLQLAVKPHAKFSIFGEGGWMRYSGTFKYDADAQNNTATDDVREGNMSFSKLRYGGGFMLRWIDRGRGKETYLRPGAFFEKPSFFTGAAKPVLSMNLQVNVYSAILLDFTYTPKTFIPGELHYPSTLERKDVNYFAVKIIRQGRLN